MTETAEGNMWQACLRLWVDDIQRGAAVAEGRCRPYAGSERDPVPWFVDFKTWQPGNLPVAWQLACWGCGLDAELAFIALWHRIGEQRDQAREAA